VAAVRLWVRADLRRRWLSWVVLGVLAGAVVGLAAAAAAGARRTERAVPTFMALGPQLEAGVLANSADFTAEKRAAVARLPEVKAAANFAVLGMGIPGTDGGALVPVDAKSARLMKDIILEGRNANPAAPDEAVIDENSRDALGLGIGKTLRVVGDAENGKVTRRLRVVGVSKSIGEDLGWQSTPAFVEDVTAAGVFSYTNMFVSLRGGEAGIPALERDVQRITGTPTNIIDLVGETRQARDTTDLESRGLWLFALAVLLGGGTLVGQALARSVTAGASDLPTWQAMGADSKTLTTALVLPATMSAVVASAVTLGLAVALSSRFPIGIARRYDLDLGVHVDRTVLGAATVGAFVAVVGGAVVVAAWRIARGEARSVRPSVVGRWATRSGVTPVVAIGTRLALEPGRGRRAVPVRSALIGAIAGVMGVVACFTFRAGVDDAVSRPERTGIVWNAVVGDIGRLPDAPLARLARQPQVQEATRARWVRSVTINDESVPTWSVEQAKGDMQWVLLDGRAPRGPSEVAFGPATLGELGVRVGDTVRAGRHRVPLHVVGEALLPWSPHSGYVEGAWIDHVALREVREKVGDDEGFDFLLLTLAPRTDRRALAATAGAKGLAIESPPAAEDVQALAKLRTLPLVLGVFLALLAVATLAHALVTTVNRRRGELAVLRALGFGRRQSRLAIAWQATLLAVIGLVFGLPLGIAFGRVVWHNLADSFPFVYSPPLAFLATLLVVPAALIVANLLAAGPGRRAARIQPAAVLRSE
jgi:hypothetical protein